MAAALLLVRDGHRVTLFERFAAPRPLGSGLMLQPTGLAVLAKLGLAETALAAGARVDRLFGATAGSARTVLDVRYSALRRDAFGIGIHRAALFELLHGAVRAAGVPLETDREVVGSTSLGARRALCFRDGSRSPGFDLVVDALGARTTLAPQAGHALAYGALWASLPWPASGFDAAALQQRYRRASVMAGVLPIGRAPEAQGKCAAFFWSLRADRLDAWREAGLDAWKADVEALWPETRSLLDSIRTADQLTFARYAHRTLRDPVEPMLVHIGDAWHSTSPQLGQGANMALLDAWALALGLRESETVDTACARAIALRRRHIRLYQAMSRVFTPVYQSDGHLLPLLRDRLVGPLSKRWPATTLQAAMVSGLVGSPLRPLGLA